MRQLFSSAQLQAAQLTGAGLIVTLVLAILILAAAVFAVISIVKRRHKKGGCHGCGGSCPSCGLSCPKDRDPGSSTGGTADSVMQTKSVPSSPLSDLNKSGKQ